MKKPAIILIIFGLCAFFLCACSGKPSSLADLPRKMPQNYSVAVAPFGQPRTPAQLISGRLPEDQGLIPEDDLEALNMRLRDVLRETSKRRFTYLSSGSFPESVKKAGSSGQPTGLAKWVAYGKSHNAQYLLVPQVLDWHERAGSQAGVTESAHARVEFFLINVAEGEIVNRSVFEEKQEGLVDNLLNVGSFIKRKGQWVTASELAGDGMKKAVKELGL